MIDKKKIILAVASAGGHWIQLLRLKPAFADHVVIYASTNKSNHVDVEGSSFYCFVDANRKTWWNFFTMVFQAFRIIYRTRPSIIVTTGAAPGLMLLIVGRFFRTKNIWLDSIANVEKLSTSGRFARYFSDLYLTQWPDLAQPDGPSFNGSVL